MSTTTNPSTVTHMKEKSTNSTPTMKKTRLKMNGMNTSNLFSPSSNSNHSSDDSSTNSNADSDTSFDFTIFLANPDPDNNLQLAKLLHPFGGIVAFGR